MITVPSYFNSSFVVVSAFALYFLVMLKTPSSTLFWTDSNVSLIELVFCTNKEVSIEKINSAFRKFIKSQSKKIIEISDEKLVSIDFNHNSASSIIDSSLTNIVGKKMGKISAWYDNEWGFSNRMCDIAEYIHKNS